MKRVEIKGAIITIDAMGTQAAIAQDIVAGEGDCVLALKGNPESLYQAVVAHVDQHLLTDFADCGAERFVVAEKSHGRKEQRIVIPMPVPKTLPGFGRWLGLKTIAVVMRMSQRDGKESYAARYFISRLAMDVKRIAHAVRSHWSIDNTCHWCLDIISRVVSDNASERGGVSLPVIGRKPSLQELGGLCGPARKPFTLCRVRYTYREDESRIREAKLRESFAWHNRFSLSLLKPPQQNLWVDSGLGRRPRLWSKASLATLAVRKP